MSAWEQFPAADEAPAPKSAWDQFPTADQPSPDLLTDVTKQAGAGLLTGIESIPAAVPSALGWLGRQFEKIAPGDSNEIAKREQLKRIIDQQRNGGIRQYVPEPQTAAGQYVRSAAEAVPGMVGATALSIPRAVGVGAASGLASEAAGQATEGTDVEPYARVGGAVAGGISAMKRLGPKPSAITLPELEKETSKSYTNALDIRATEFSAPAMSNIYNKVRSQILEDFTKEEAPITHQLLDKMAGKVVEPAADPLQAMTGVPRSAAPPISGKEIEGFQKKLFAIKSGPGHTGDNAASNRARAMIDDELAKLPDEAMVSGDPGAFRDAIKEARGNAAATYRMRVLENAREAQQLGGKPFTSLVRPPLRGQPTPAKQMGFSPDEVAAIRNIDKPGIGARAIRAVGGLTGSDPFRTALNVGAIVHSGGATAPITVASLAAKKLAQAMMQRRIDAAVNLAAQRSPLARSRPMPSPQYIPARAGVAALGQPSNQAEISPPTVRVGTRY